MVAAAVLWGTIGPAVEQLQRHGGLSSAGVSFWRAVIGTLAMAAFIGLSPRTRARRRTRRTVAIGLLLGASTAVSQLCYYAALSDLGIGPATLVVLGLGPLLVAVGEALFLGRRPTRRLFVVIAVSIVGMGMLVGGAGTAMPKGGSLPAGLALSFGSAATYAASVIASGPSSHALGAAGLNLLVFLGGVISLAPVVAIGGLDVPSDPQTVALVVYLGLVASALAYGLFFVAARRLKPTVVSVVALIEPLVAAVLGWILFGQALGVLGIAGGVVLLGAVVALGGEDPVVAESQPVGAAVPVPAGTG